MTRQVKPTLEKPDIFEGHYWPVGRRGDNVRNFMRARVDNNLTQIDAVYTRAIYLSVG